MSLNEYFSCIAFLHPVGYGCCKPGFGTQEQGCSAPPCESNWHVPVSAFRQCRPDTETTGEHNSRRGLSLDYLVLGSWVPCEALGVQGHRKAAQGSYSHLNACLFLRISHRMANDADQGSLCHGTHTLPFLNTESPETSTS